MDSLQQVYYNPTNPGSYGGVSPLLRAVRKQNTKSKKRTKDKDTTRKEVVEWLRTQDTYTLHKPVRKRFERNRYVVYRPNELWQADLNDMRGLSEHNDGTNYLLTVIDVFSKRLFVRPLKRKSGTEVAEAFRQILEEENKDAPRCLQTDKGTEFTGVTVKRLFDDHAIKYVTTQNPDVKASVVERVNRTLKTRMWHYLTHKNTYRYIDVLDRLVSAYNHNEHRSLGGGLCPTDVHKKRLDKRLLYRVWCHMYGRPLKRTRPKYKVGATVRIAKEKGTFAKGYETNWSKEIFVVDSVYGSSPKPLYTLKDLNNKPLVGRFYEHELQPVTILPDHLYQIEKIVRVEGKGRGKRYLVKWVGYGDDFNSWVAADKLKKLA